MDEIFLLPFVFIGLAAAMLGLAWMALGEYQRLFREDPARVMSAEVLLAMLSELGGPGYLAATLAFFGAWMLLVGISIGVFFGYHIVFGP